MTVAMSKPASRATAKLVCQTLPKPLFADQWNVRVVENFEDVRAELFAGTVYVHSTWTKSVFDARLAHVTKHYPLAVGPFREVNPMLLGARWPKSRMKQAFVSHAITIERSRWRGQFTGALTVGEAFIARAADGDEQYADRYCNRAIEEVAQAVRSKARQRAEGLIELQDQARQFLGSIDARYFLDSGGLVPLNRYERLLPESSLQALRRYHARHVRPRRGVPLRVIQSQCFEAIRNMQPNDIQTLLLQLAADFSKLQPVTDEAIAIRLAHGAEVAVKRWRRGLRNACDARSCSNTSARASN